MARLGTVILVLLALAVGLATVERPAPPASYTVCQPLDVFTLDPQRMSYNQDLRVCYAIYEGLTRWDNGTFRVVPAVAERWDVSPDRRTYTFHLRSGARWSNGDAVVAGDFVYAWKRAILPDTAADYAQQFFLIDGAEAFFGWRTRQLASYAGLPASERTHEAALLLRAEADSMFARTVGVEAVDDHTLRVRLARPVPYFLDLCCFAAFHPVHPPTVESCVTVDAATGRIDQRSEWTRAGRIVTNGPYVVARWRFKRDLRLERNQFYWNPAMVRSDSVSIVVIGNPNTAVLAYQTGGADWVEEVLADYLPEMIEQASRGERSDLHKVPTFGTYFWSFNCGPTLPGGAPNPFRDARVRRAFAMATNKRDLVEKVRRLGEPVADSFIPPGTIPGYDPDHAIRGVAFDPRAARALLAQAGWRASTDGGPPVNSAGEPFPVVDMLCSTGSFHEKIAQAMGAMWESALGVRTRVVAKDGKSVGDDLKRHNYVVGRGSWFGDYGDPTTFLDVHRTGDGNNDRGYSDPEFDELLRRADEATDDAQRMRLLAEAERYTVEESMPILPIFHYVRYYLYDGEALTGLTSHPRLVQYLWKIEKKPRAGAGR